MREIFTYGSVGRAPGDRCLYPDDKQIPMTKIPNNKPGYDLEESNPG